jgi:hypothetical protein
MMLTPYTAQPWPRGRYKRYRARRACQRNAVRLVLDYPDELRLVKGYALMPRFDIWAGHWWGVDSESRVVDPTWKNEGRAYIGVEEVDSLAYIKRTEKFYELEVENFAPPAVVELLERALASR